MQPGQMKLKRLRFPGRAGELQDAGATPALAKELGDNYGRYHGFLSDELAKVGRPEPRDFDDIEAYMKECAKAQEIVRAEALLRNCRRFRREGRRLDAPLDPEVPLIDDRDRLVSVETGKPQHP
jgi:hypothetical protein